MDQKQKKKSAFLAHVRQDWYVYAALLLALFALLWTVNHQASIELGIRAEYQRYINECHEKCGGGIQWNQTLEPVLYNTSPAQWESWEASSSPGDS